MLFLFFRPIILSENSVNRKVSTMKKFFALLLALVLFAPSALADTDAEIMFHGIPWGISVNELVDQLRDRKIPVQSGDIEADASMAIWAYQFRNSYMNNIESTGYEIPLYFFSNPDAVKIAGYPVQDIQLYAHYDIADGILKLEANNSKYYMVLLQFDISDEMAVGVYADLHKKLSALYGNGAENTTKEVETTYTYTVWHGANNTAVCLYRSVNPDSDYQFVHLMYGKTDCEQTLREVRRLVIEHEIQSVADDSTGL